MKVGQRVLVGVYTGEVLKITPYGIRVKLDNDEFYEFVTCMEDQIVLIPEGATTDQIQALKGIIT